jgi:hypothetical protein
VTKEEHSPPYENGTLVKLNAKGRGYLQRVNLRAAWVLREGWEFGASGLLKIEGSMISAGVRYYAARPYPAGAGLLRLRENEVDRATVGDVLQSSVKE